MNSRAARGFTLIELMIAMTMLAIIMGGVVSVTVSMQRGYIRQREVARSEDALRVAELTITRILQTAGSNPLNMAAGTANSPRVEPLTAPFDTLQVLADFNPVDGDTGDLLENMMVYALNDTLFVRWQQGGAAAPVAFPVRSLLFQYDSAGTILNDPVIIRRAATRVRITLQAPKHNRTNVLSRRDTWVYLRNRR
ncbi:MAG TPA: prepilin-type N-terminal cleavage/methylation domain-containing protein [Gemmatimonadales bacterium]|nr:prepilin-type N-terminal cleavage/methylation domain-containing protein [Gemmatimonadales bacterium]